jgi:integrase
MRVAETTVAVIQKMRAERGWAATTTKGHAATVAGAFARLTLYTDASTNVLLRLDPLWRDFLRGINIECNSSHDTKQPKAITRKQVDAMIDKLSPDHALAAMLAWTTCARMGCVTQLATWDIKLAGDKLTVTFKRGKRARMVGPFTVSTTVPPAWLERLAKLLKKRPKGFLWPLESRSSRARWQLDLTRKVREATGDDELENRSFRRGALQQLAAAGTPESTLLLFSGHRDAAMLMRYLNWGQAPNERLAKMQKAASNANPSAE